MPFPNNRVELRYYSDERRSEILTGGVPGWNWLGLKPVLDTAKLDALYINFLSGWELDLETAKLIRQHFRGPIYCDIHMMVWAVMPDGLRKLQPLPNVAEWCSCFDLMQLNEDEMAMMAPDPMALAATALANGVRSSDRDARQARRGLFRDARLRQHRRSSAPRPLGATFGPLRTALVAAPNVNEHGGDPTGCGDVWGATYFSRLLAGDNLGDAILAAHRAAARNVDHRGATGSREPSQGDDQPHVTTVITVPPSLDDHSFEQVLEQLAPLPADEKILVDARHARWASPYGLTALLTLAQTRTERPSLAVPELEDTASYWARAAFFQHAETVYDLRGSYPKRREAGESNVLLEITPITKSNDVHDIVSRVQAKAQQIIKTELQSRVQGDRRILDDALRGLPEHHRARRTRRLGRRPDLSMDETTRPPSRRDRGVRRRNRISSIAGERPRTCAEHAMG